MKLNSISIVIASILGFFQMYGQERDGFENGSESYEIDNSIIYGVLDNGFTYYIKPIKDSGTKIKMTLMVKTGFSYEEAHELDFSHHIEHLSFRESHSFPKGLKGNSELLARLEMKFNELYARTGGSETLYYFNPPAKNFEAVTTGLAWFRDIASGLDLSEKSINRERGVLLQEYLSGEASRDRRSVEELLSNNLFPWLTSPTNFIEHNKSFAYQELQQFYKEWYRPDRIGLGIAGDIDDVEQLKRTIENTFNDLDSAVLPLEEQNWEEVYAGSEPRFAVVQRKKAPANAIVGNPVHINLFFRDQKAMEDPGTIKSVQRSLKVKMIINILNNRFRERANVYNNFSESSGVHTIYIRNGHFNKPANAFKIIIRSEIDKEKKALQKSLHVLSQVKRFGVTEEEVEYTKKEFLENLSPDFRLSANYWLGEIENHFIYGEALPSEKIFHLRNFVKDLSKEELERCINELISEMPEDIGLIVPQNYETDLDSEKWTRNFITKIFKEPVSPYENPTAITELMSKREIDSLTVGEPNNIVDGELGSKEYRLKNGLRVILKTLTSNYKTNDMVLHGFSPYGASCFSKDDYYSAIYAPSVIANSGVAEFSRFDLQRFYGNTHSLQMGISPYINYDEAGIKATVSKEEFKELLQLVYLYFTKPRKDGIAFDDWRNQQLRFTALSINPTNDLLDAIGELSQDYSQKPTASKRIGAIENVEFEKAYEIYDKLFGSPENYTFIVVGQFKEREVLPMLTKYLGNIPQKRIFECNEENYGSDALNPGPVSRKVHTSDLYDTQNSYYGLEYIKPKSTTDNWKEELKVKALGMVANRLLFRLRSDEGLSLYYFGAGGRYNRILDRYEIKFRLNCTPGELATVKNSTKKVIEDLKKGDLPNEALKISIAELSLRYSPHVMERPREISEKIYKCYRYDESIADDAQVEEYLNSLTVDDMQEAANEYFQDQYSYELTMENESLKN